MARYGSSETRLTRRAVRRWRALPTPLAAECVRGASGAVGRAADLIAGAILSYIGMLVWPGCTLLYTERARALAALVASIVSQHLDEARLTGASARPIVPERTALVRAELSNGGRRCRETAAAPPQFLTPILSALLVCGNA